MKQKKLVSVLLAGAMAATLLAGCGNTATESNNETAPAASAAEEQTPADDQAAEADGQEAAADGEISYYKFDELQEITMYGMVFFGDKGLSEVMDAINEISIDKLNVKVDYKALDVGAYMEQVGLMFSGGEHFDLVQTCPMTPVLFGTMQAQNELMDIADLLDEYAPELKEMMADYLPATTIDGATYAVPVYRQYNSSQYLVMRTDILEYLGLVEEAEAIDSYADCTALFQKILDAQPDLPEELQTTAVIGNQGAEGNIITSNSAGSGAENWADHYGFDILGDGNFIITVDPETDTVANFFETEEFQTELQVVREWYQKGFVYKDSATSLETGDTLMANGVIFASFMNGEYGIAATKGSSIGYDLTCVKSLDLPLQTYNVAQWCWAVPVTSENPEAAVDFLNLMYTNSDIENLFCYGIEGRDYTLNENGEVVVSSDYSWTSNDFLYGNQFSAYPVAGNGASFREDALADMAKAEISKYLGFIVNTDPIANEITSVCAAKSKYQPGLESGTLDPAESQKMIEEMNASGAKEMVTFYQEALDAWLAAQ